jgi:hypothetical protein
MNKSDIEHLNVTSKTVSSDELTPEEKKTLEGKLQNALLRVLIKNGGEAVLLKPLTNKTQADSR